MVAEKIVVDPDRGLVKFEGVPKGFPEWHWYPADVVGRMFGMSPEEVVEKYFHLSRTAEDNVLPWFEEGGSEIQNGDVNLLDLRLWKNPERIYLPAGWVQQALETHMGIKELEARLRRLKDVEIDILHVAGRGYLLISRRFHEICGSEDSGSEEIAELERMEELFRRFAPHFTIFIDRLSDPENAHLWIVDSARWRFDDDGRMVRAG